MYRLQHRWFSEAFGSSRRLLSVRSRDVRVGLTIDRASRQGTPAWARTPKLKRKMAMVQVMGAKRVPRGPAEWNGPLQWMGTDWIVELGINPLQLVWARQCLVQCHSLAVRDNPVPLRLTAGHR